jgi:hypothetical protein
MKYYIKIEACLSLCKEGWVYNDHLKWIEKKQAI